MKNNILPIGSVHGRFQPLHNGHVEYILEAKQECQHLIIGITQIDSSNLEKSPLDPHREMYKNNPLTFFERYFLIKQVLVDIGFDYCEFDIIPFPIDTPDILQSFLPIEIPIFTTIYDKWNEHKINILEEKGYDVRVLYKRDNKKIVGEKIREMIIREDQNWEYLVPQATKKLIYKNHIRKRLKHLASNI